MADDNNPVNKTNQPTTPQLQSGTQPRTRLSSRVNETPVSDSVRNLISQFNSPVPEQIDQYEQAINESQRILTRAYSNLTGCLPIELPLPQITRPRIHHPEPVLEEQEPSLTDINQPSSSLGPSVSGGSGRPPSPPHSSSIPQKTPSPPPTPRNMAGVNANPNANMPWMDQDAVAVPGIQHPLPKHPEKLLPKFNPESNEPAEDHVKKFMLAVRLLDVEHEDVVCRIFPYTFEGKASTWYFSLTAGSITSWNEFDIAFMNKFGDDKTPAILVSELSRIRIEPKEKVKDFNQRFLTLRNRIPITSRPTEDVTIEFYTSALPGKIAIFVRQKAKLTLAENFEEAIKVEKHVTATKTNPVTDTDTASSSRKKTDSPAKATPSSDKRGQDALDLDSLQRVIKKLSNEIIDLKRALLITPQTRSHQNSYLEDLFIIQLPNKIHPLKLTALRKLIVFSKQ